MWPFKPDIPRMKEETDIKGLIKALGHRNHSVRDAAASALGEFEDSPEVQAILSELRGSPNRAELKRRLDRIAGSSDQYNRIDGCFGGHG